MLAGRVGALKSHPDTSAAVGGWQWFGLELGLDSGQRVRIRHLRPRRARGKEKDQHIRGRRVRV